MVLACPEASDELPVCLLAGTRFNTRGVDDEGNAANFVETEQVGMGRNTC